MDKILTVSTGHILPTDREALEEEETFSVGDFSYGFFMFVPTKDEDFNNKYKDYSPYFKKVVRHAMKLKCIYICFDCDAAPLDGFKWLAEDWG